ncbi:hypothetical protein ZEAMMB73_Zm00001d038853 [Zea mays]|uniref:Uncharacterized protein n=1 Tax=Zea mays TaxID=4577 RepID=A0A1D6MBB7_MAIZE|nr:hypothetical protein ZEAMMB73_Zm00001d038853 [Zea mays]
MLKSFVTFGIYGLKTPEVLARDRLLGSFSVKPVVNRVKFTLVGLAGSLILCILLYLGCVPVEGLSRKCTVTLPQGHLGLMRSVEKLICRSIAKRGA